MVLHLMVKSYPSSAMEIGHNNRLLKSFTFSWMAFLS